MDFAAAVPLPHAAAVYATVSGSHGACSALVKHSVLGILIIQMHTRANLINPAALTLVQIGHRARR
jgi:hypothetical protein